MRLHLLARRGPRYDVTLARGAGWYVLAEVASNAARRRQRTSPRGCGGRSGVGPRGALPGRRARAARPAGRALALRFTNDDANYPWSLTLRRLASGRFAAVEEWADLHHAMGGHLAGEARDKLEEEAARAKASFCGERWRIMQPSGKGGADLVAGGQMDVAEDDTV